MSTIVGSPLAPITNQDDGLKEIYIPEEFSTSSISVEKLLKFLPIIIEGIYTDTNYKRLKTSVVLIRKSLSVETNPPIDTIIEYGFVPRLIQLLQYPDPVIQEESAWALTNIASGSQEHTQILVDHGIIESFISILHSPHQKICDQAVWGLGNIGGDSPQMRNTVLAHNILPILLELFHKHESNLSIIRNCTWSLSNLFRGKPLPPFEYVENALPTIIRLLYHKDSETLRDLLWCISYITDTSNEKIQRVLDCVGVIPRLLEILSDTDRSLINPALRTIGNFLTGDDYQTQMVLDAGVLSILRSLLNDPKSSLRKEVCWCFSNVTSGNRSQIQMVIDSNSIPIIVEKALNDDIQVKKEAIWALSNCCCGANQDQIEYLANNNVVKALIEGVSLSADMHKVALEGLSFIARAGTPKDHPLSNLDKPNKYKDLFNDFVKKWYIHSSDNLESYFQEIVDNLKLPVDVNDIDVDSLDPYDEEVEVLTPEELLSGEEDNDSTNEIIGEEEIDDDRTSSSFSENENDDDEDDEEELSTITKFVENVQLN